jgi:hypothetical protein
MTNAIRVLTGLSCSEIPRVNQHAVSFKEIIHELGVLLLFPEISLDESHNWPLVFRLVVE